MNEKMKYVLITGASSGIGRYLAIKLSSDYNIILHGRDDEKLLKTKSLCNKDREQLIFKMDFGRLSEIEGAITNFIFENNDFYLGYQADFYKGKNFQAAKAQYDKLCKDIAASNIRLKTSDAGFKLSGTAEKANEAATTHSKFSFSNSGLSGYNIYAELKYKDGNYSVSLIAGDVEYNDDKATN